MMKILVYIIILFQPGLLYGQKDYFVYHDLVCQAEECIANEEFSSALKV